MEETNTNGKEKGKRTPKRKTFADEEGYVVIEKKKVVTNKSIKPQRCQKLSCTNGSMVCFARSCKK